MPKNSDKPTYKPGSLLRTAWYDEIYPPDSYDAKVNDGWYPPDIVCYKTKEHAIERYEKVDNDEDCGYVFIPWGVPNLLYVNCEYDHNTDNYWCQVIWEDRVIWIHQDWLILIKEATQE